MLTLLFEIVIEPNFLVLFSEGDVEFPGAADGDTFKVLLTLLFSTLAVSSLALEADASTDMFLILGMFSSIIPLGLLSALASVDALVAALVASTSGSKSGFTGLTPAGWRGTEEGHLTLGLVDLALSAAAR